MGNKGSLQIANEHEFSKQLREAERYRDDSFKFRSGEGTILWIYPSRGNAPIPLKRLIITATYQPILSCISANIWEWLIIIDMMCINCFQDGSISSRRPALVKSQGWSSESRSSTFSWGVLLPRGMSCCFLILLRSDWAGYRRPSRRPLALQFEDTPQERILAFERQPGSVGFGWVRSLLSPLLKFSFWCFTTPIFPLHCFWIFGHWVAIVPWPKQIHIF